MRSTRWVVSSLLASSVALTAAPGVTPGQEILARYLAASESTRGQVRGLSMEVEIDAQLPKLKKRGRLHALRSISRLGRITYDALRWAGDNVIKTDVIARYLKAETQAQEGPADLAITPANYKFKYKGPAVRGDTEVHVFEITPHKKKVGLFKGELWVDASTCLPVREQGRFVKNPSIFLKRVEFVRDYEIRDGVPVPVHIESVVDTRLVGRAELNITFSNFTRADEIPVSVNPVDQ